MAINVATLPKDIFSSVGKELQILIPQLQGEAVKYPIFFEGTPSRRDASDTPVTGIEIRFNGPSIAEVCTAQYKVCVELDLLITLPLTENVFTIHDAVGICMAALNRSFKIYELATGNFLGCLDLAPLRRFNEPIEVQHYGQIDPNKAVLQASVAAEYESLLY